MMKFKSLKSIPNLPDLGNSFWDNFILIFIILLVISILPADAKEWHVTLDGKSYDYSTPYSRDKNGAGTESNPWSLEFAIGNPKNPESAADKKANWILPGDIIWVHEGRYIGYFETIHYQVRAKDTIGCHMPEGCMKLENTFEMPRMYTSKLEGDSLHPIILRAWRADKVILDAEDKLDGVKFNQCLLCPLGHAGIKRELVALVLDGRYTIAWGLQVTNSYPVHYDKYPPALRPVDLPEDASRFCGGVTLQGKGNRLVNSVVHGMAGVAVASFQNGVASEMEGNIIYNNGITSTDRGHGHAFYLQNNVPQWKVLKNNILFNQYGFGFHIYRTTRDLGPMRNFRVEGNIAFNNGSITTYGEGDIPAGGYANFLGGGHCDREKWVIRNNHFYRNLNMKNADSTNYGNNFYLNADSEQDYNAEMDISHNYIIGGGPAVEVVNFRKSSFIENFIMAGCGVWRIKPVPGYGAPALVTYKDVLAFPYKSVYPVGASKTSPTGITWDRNHYLMNNLDCGDLHKNHPDGFHFIFDMSDGAKKKPWSMHLPLASGRENWQTTLGFDNSIKLPTDYTDLPLEKDKLMIFVLPNDDAGYNPGRRRIVVYNCFNLLAARDYKLDITDKVKNVLQPGTSYLIRDVQDYYNIAARPQPGYNGAFGPATQLTLNLKPGQAVELPRDKAGKLGTGTRNVPHTAPLFAVYTLDFFPYEVSLKAVKGKDKSRSVKAGIKPLGKFFYAEKFVYHWSGSNLQSRETSIPEIKLSKEEAEKNPTLNLEIEDINTGTKIRKTITL